jgi:phage gp29-like protein
MIKRIRSWRNVLADILDCVPKGFSVNELYWTIRNGQYEIDGARHWHQKKFRFGKISDIESDPEQLRLVLDPRQVDKFRGLVPESELSLATTDGIDLESDPQFRKRFVVAFCKARSGNPARTSLLRTCTFLFLFKNYDIKWWIQFAEILLGYRVGKYDAAQTDQKEILEKALAGLATDSAAVISKDAEIEFVEMAQKAASHKTYTDIKDWCNEEMSEVVLGHTGTTSGTPGKLGQEDMAKEVKQELVEADAAVMDETISDQIIRNYIEINFGQQEEYPYYQTDLSPALNLSEEADLDIKIQEMGGDIPAEYVKEKYGRPLLNKDGEALIPRSKQATLLPAKAVLAASKKKLLRQR